MSKLREILRKNKTIVFLYRSSKLWLKRRYKWDYKVNVGGGTFIKKGWRVLDYTTKRYNYGKGFVDYEHNLASFKKLPFKDNELKAIFSSYTLEHIPQKYMKHLFKEFNRVLKPNGSIKIVVPDYDYHLNKFLNSIATYLVHNLEEKKKGKIAEDIIKLLPKNIYKSQPGHLNWFNRYKLCSMLKEAGFRITKSDIDFDCRKDNNCLIVEARK